MKERIFVLTLSQYYKDPSQCHKFVDCIDGQPKHNVCPPGLHFNDASGVCTWEAAAGRTGCVREECTKKMSIEFKRLII